ncbi:DUF4407 domain-containing protein [Tamlana flava]|uniref:DUF4407 domain-containing protein n=1 Tax=Tamlana flava TaxID=3158572 RepID=UPI00351AC330
MKLRLLENNRFLWWFAGEDRNILHNCNKYVRIKFSCIGLIVIHVMLITFISISYGVYKLLESYYLGLLIGIYASVLVLFLYLFIQYTLTKNVLPHKKGKKIEVSISYVIRFSFLFALGLLVSQPIEYYFFSDEVDNLMNVKIVESIYKKNESLNLDYSAKVKELKELKISDNDLKYEIERFQLEKNKSLNQFIEYQYSRNFFIEKMILMDKNLIYIWPFSVLFIVFFSLPFYLKFRIDFDNNYYRNKITVQRNLLEQNYNYFLKSYNNILNRKFPEFNLEFKTPYKDPPYNTERIEHPQLGSEKEFSKWLLNEGS